MDKTAWVLLLPVNNNGQDPEKRHIMDLAFGVFKLESAGISKDNIFIVIDGNDYDMISGIIVKFTGCSHTIYKTDEIEKLRSDMISFSSLALFIFGHGHELGLASYKDISPHVLLTAIQRCSNFRTAIVYLGPCYSGVFNYPPALSSDQDIIFIGSTKFYSSIASRVTERIAGDKEFSWIANFFMLGTFKWFSNPFDIDGDNKYTIIDSYKFISIYSNQVYQNIKKEDFPYLLQDVPKHHKQLIKLKKRQTRINQALESSQDLGWKYFDKLFEEQLCDIKFKIQQIQKRVDSVLDIDLFNIQEPWISDPTKAMNITYCNGNLISK